MYSSSKSDQPDFPGVYWPPKDAPALFKWLSLVDHNAKAHLIKYFVEHPYKHHLIVLEVDKQDTFGVIFELNQTAVQFTTYANSRKKEKVAVNSI